MQDVLSQVGAELRAERSGRPTQRPAAQARADRPRAGDRLLGAGPGRADRGTQRARCREPARAREGRPLEREGGRLRHASPLGGHAPRRSSLRAQERAQGRQLLSRGVHPGVTRRPADEDEGWSEPAHRPAARVGTPLAQCPAGSVGHLGRRSAAQCRPPGQTEPDRRCRGRPGLGSRTAGQGPRWTRPGLRSGRCRRKDDAAGTATGHVQPRHHPGAGRSAERRHCGRAVDPGQPGTQPADPPGLAGWGFVGPGANGNSANEYIRRLSIKAPSTRTSVGVLSGGNQQKVALSRALEGNAHVLLVEEPTQGIDIDAKAEVRQLLREFAAAGGAVIVATSEFEELIDLADEASSSTKGASPAASRAKTSRTATFFPSLSREGERTPTEESTMTGTLEGKVALVTGASRGIGRAIAMRLAADACRGHRALPPQHAARRRRRRLDRSGRWARDRRSR